MNASTCQQLLQATTHATPSEAHNTIERDHAQDSSRPSHLETRPYLNAAYNASLEADRAKDAELLKKQTEIKSGYEADIDEVVSSIPPSRDELRKLRAGFLMSLKLNKV